MDSVGLVNFNCSMDQKNPLLLPELFTLPLCPSCQGPSRLFFHAYRTLSLWALLFPVHCQLSFSACKGFIAQSVNRIVIKIWKGTKIEPSITVDQRPFLAMNWITDDANLLFKQNNSHAFLQRIYGLFQRYTQTD